MPPLTKEEFANLRRAGLSVGQIVASEAGSDSAQAAPALPTESGMVPSGSELAGLVGGATDAIGGLKGVGLGVGGLGGVMLARRLLRGRGAAPQAGPPPPMPPPMPPPPRSPAATSELAQVVKPVSTASLHELTAEDIANHPELKRFSPGYLMRKSKYEAILTGEKAGGAKATPAAEAAPSARPEPTRDITMIEGGKARAAKAPAAVAPNGPGVGKGLPGTRLARRAQAMERMKATRAAAESGRQPLKVLEGGAGAPPDAAAASLEAEQAMKEAGIGPAQRAAARAAMAATLEATPAAERAAAIAAFRMTLAREGPGALMGLLMYGPSFLKGQGLGEQMNATSPLLDMLRPSRVLPNAMPQSQQTGGI